MEKEHIMLEHSPLTWLITIMDRVNLLMLSKPCRIRNHICTIITKPLPCSGCAMEHFIIRSTKLENLASNKLNKCYGATKNVLVEIPTRT